MTLNDYFCGLLVLAFVWYCGYLVWPDLPEQIFPTAGSPRNAETFDEGNLVVIWRLYVGS